MSSNHVKRPEEGPEPGSARGEVLQGNHFGNPELYTRSWKDVRDRAQKGAENSNPGEPACGSRALYQNRGRDSQR